MKDIIFVESEKDINKAISCFRKGDGCLIVSLSAMTAWNLEKREVPFKIPYDYYHLDELFHLKENLYARTKEICDYIDKKIFEFIPFFKKNNLKPASAIFFPIKCGLNLLSQELINVARVLEAEKPKKIIIFESFSKKPNLVFGLTPAKMDLYPELIRAVSKKYSIKPKVIESGPCRKFVSSRIYKKLESTHNTGYAFLKHLYLKIKLIKNSRPGRKKESETIQAFNSKFSPKIMVFKNNYSIRSVTQYMKAHCRGNIVEYEKLSKGKENIKSNLNKGIDELWNSLRQDPGFNNLFTMEGVNLLFIVGGYFRNLLSQGLTQAADTYNKVESVLADNEIDALLLPNISYPDDWAAAAVCKERAVPVVTWQHGSYAVFDPHTQPIYYDIKNADYFLAFGNSVRKAFLESAKEWNTEIIPVGSCALDKIGLKNNSGRSSYLRPAKQGIKTVLMPLRALNMPNASDSCQVYPFAVYWRQLAKMLELFSKFSNLRFILKLRPSSISDGKLLASFLKAKRINNMIIKKKPNFVKLLPEADLVMVDWPYTTLLEAVKTELPVICYKRLWPLRRGVEELIKKRCFISEDLKSLEALLKRYLNNQLPVLKDKELLSEYGTLYNDGNARQRALNFLNQVNVA